MRKITNSIGIIILLIIILTAISFLIGIFIGRGNIHFRANGFTKVDTILSIVEGYYVDSVNYKDIQEKAINGILQNLDPHSVYLNPEENKKATQGLVGKFSGIGVQFNTLKDTIIVVKVLDRGPSERAGLKVGDRILMADTTNLLSISTDSIMRVLKGPNMSVVTLSILRDRKLITKKVVRGEVPVNTILAKYMATPNTLYIKLSEWGMNSYKEFLEAYNKHKKETKAIILDLRDNPGGLLDIAIKVANEFLPENKLMLYAKGNNFPRQEYLSDGTGLLKDMPLVVLANENSASASEIFTGIMQDYDRATIIGRRTFGKGLIQEPFELKDNSVVRLTVARYYIPSGRSIQKSYKDGTDKYLSDIITRYYNGELSGKEAFHPIDSTEYKTEGGRIVYGAGGILPDIFIPIDSLGVTSYYINVNSKILPIKYTFDYSDTNRKKLSKFKNIDELTSYLDTQNILNEFIAYANANGVKPLYYLINKSKGRLKKEIYDGIINFTLGTQNSIKYLNRYDDMVNKAIDIIKENKWKPVIQYQEKNEQQKARLN